MLVSKISVLNNLNKDFIYIYYYIYIYIICMYVCVYIYIYIYIIDTEFCNAISEDAVISVESMF